MPRLSVTTTATNDKDDSDLGLVNGSTFSAAAERATQKPVHGIHNCETAIILNKTANDNNNNSNKNNNHPSAMPENEPHTNSTSSTKRFHAPVIYEKYTTMSPREKKCLDRRLAVDEAMQGLGLDFDDAVTLVATLDEQFKMDLTTFIDNTRRARLRDQERRKKMGVGKGIGGKERGRLVAMGVVDLGMGSGDLGEDDRKNDALGGQGEEQDGVDAEEWRLSCE
ncbi:uncharacterized protein BKA78DRAFT_354430 [Phyllosticta capitalensis]|uniref:uncharacterized protein n=1 Tax=Phyllosticta capitalensis TaxID=121624 RepID=UPI00313255DB